jgi:hypothetical protein
MLDVHGVHTGKDSKRHRVICHDSHRTTARRLAERTGGQMVLAVRNLSQRLHQWRCRPDPPEGCRQQRPADVKPFRVPKTDVNRGRHEGCLIYMPSHPFPSSILHTYPSYQTHKKKIMPSPPPHERKVHPAANLDAVKDRPFHARVPPAHPLEEKGVCPARPQHHPQIYPINTCSLASTRQKNLPVRLRPRIPRADASPGQRPARPHLLPAGSIKHPSATGGCTGAAPRGH